MHEPMITIYESVGGWKAVWMEWTEDGELGGFWEPWQVGFFGYQNPSEAERDAKEWAEAEGLPYIPPKAKH